MEKDCEKNVVNHFEAGSNCQVFNGRISGCVFAMPGSTVTQQPVAASDSKPPEGEQPEEINEEERNEERFHFVHPEIDDEEAWRIHDSVKRLVTHQRVKVICQYLKESRKNRKVLLPETPSVAYAELVRMGMPNGEGFSEKYFSSCYLR